MVAPAFGHLHELLIYDFTIEELIKMINKLEGDVGSGMGGGGELGI